MAKDGLSDDDKALFRSYMEEVLPLHAKNKPASTQITPSIKTYFLSDFIRENVFAETRLSYTCSGLPSKRFQDLKNGKIPWEAKLDLHGLNADKARDALSHFIQVQTQLNTRCVLIIHGKSGRQHEPPLIKNLVNRWLPQFDELLAFHSAMAKDGGMGAVYVLLKRNKDTQYLR